MRLSLTGGWEQARDFAVTLRIGFGVKARVYGNDGNHGLICNVSGNLSYVRKIDLSQEVQRRTKEPADSVRRDFDREPTVAELLAIEFCVLCAGGLQ
jgi:hypothetical protein